ncbi:transcriptional regulator [Altererythrobacter sp. TH136]|uniref:winged helix-turn-helix domain-containing protein n=1 Tax=Altererythrobacter sp. TH136 TaxID=2067415 RepID=UPI00143DD012|nr:transcriptional regulator [Altererythrobacter sp. TH136]
MTEPAISFGPFVLDAADRRLLRAGEPVEVSARYFDALALLVSEGGRLVTKERFHEEVWRGIPVTDEALTQCIRSLRRALDDDAAAPRFIETVPRHGYRFIAPLTGAPAPGPAARHSPPVVHDIAQDTAAAALGGASAGIVGGLLYLTLGLISPSMGTASTLLVLVSMNLLLGLAGGGAVGLGVSLMRRGGDAVWRAALGGTAGGLLVGAVAHMIGTDLFELLFGRSPGAVTGAAEGAVMGLAVGVSFATAMGLGYERQVLGAATGLLSGAIAGVALVATGGKLMAGSLAELAQQFPDSRLGMGRAGAMLASAGEPQWMIALATVIEGALFAGGVVGALLVVRRLRISGR